MRKILAIILLLSVCGNLPAGTTNGRQRVLDKGWTVFPAGALSAERLSKGAEKLPRETYEAVVPSTVMGTLVANGEYAGLLEGMAYADADRSRFDEPWIYLKEFEVSDLAPGGHILLQFDGISYAADIWLNGHFIDSVEGPFRQWCYDVTGYISRYNTLCVKVRHAKPGEPGIGFVDWNPRPLDESMGIFREVRLTRTGPVAMQHTAVRSTLDGSASLTVDTRLTNLSGEKVDGRLAGEVDGRQFRYDITLEPFEEKTVLLTPQECPQLLIENPRLWWCNGMGSPEMYSLNLSFITENGLSDSQTTDFGIRKVEQYLNRDGSLAFRLNGRDVLLRGAGWTDDIFLRDDPASNRLQAEYVRDMNLNLVRFEQFWGTSEDIYDLCDRYGLMVLAGWSCFWEWDIYLGKPHDPKYGGILTPDEIDLTAKSFEDQVLWLRSHPSILAWFTGSDRIPHPDLEPLYRDFLGANDDRGYIISASGLKSPVSGPSGTKMMGPYEYVGPVYWYSPEAPGKAFGFNTETGIGAQLPVKESLQKMGLTMKYPTGTEWDFHCTVAAENMHDLAALRKAVDGKYGKPSDIDDFLRKADHLNYDGTRAMFEAFRVNVPKATGIVQWMLNSAWPSLYWQLYDWYGQPTAAYYSTKKANAPVQLIYNYAERAVYAVNETLETVDGQAYIEVLKPDGKPAYKASRHVRAVPMKPVKVVDIPAFKSGVEFLFLRLEADGAVTARNEYVLTPREDVHLWKKSSWYQTPISDYADLKPLSKLRAADVSATVDQDFTVTLRNNSSCVAFFLRLSLKDKDGELLCPALWEDNYLTLAPGETRTVECRLRPEDSLRPATLTLSGWNVREQSVSLK